METARHEEYPAFRHRLPFSFQPGIARSKTVASASPNWHENVELQLCLSGGGKVLLDGEVYPFRQGDVIIVNSNVIHYTGTDTELEYACLIIDPAFCETVGFDTRHTAFVPYLANARPLQALFGELKTAYESEGELRRPRLNLILLKILLEIYENATATPTVPKKQGHRFDEIKKAILFLREHYAQKITLDEVAEEVLMDKYTLSKEFKKLTGQTVITYLNEYRCKKALQLISAGSSVTGAAAGCGFGNF